MSQGGGLGRFVEDVVLLHHKARAALRVDTVHDLRVAIRRCRSLAQGLREVDDDDGAARWKALSDAGRPLFQGLGELRDNHVMKEHVSALLAGDPAQPLVIAAVDARIRATKESARAAVRAFDPAAWRAAAKELPARAEALLLERALFDHLSLRRLYEAKELHQQAMRSRSSTALHALRIGTKKLRYSIENFLPDAHIAVGKVLKKLQDVLGDIHDLDVLVSTLGSEHVRLHSDDRSRVSSLVRARRDGLVLAYRAQTLGEGGAWVRVRAALADGPAVALAHEALMLKKASARGVPQSAARALERSVHVLVHAFRRDLRALRDPRLPSLLRWACACAGVDGGGKKAARFVSRLPAAVGFVERDRALLLVVAAGGFGRAPALADPRVQALPARDRPLAVSAGALLHLAVCLAASAPFVVRRTRDVAVVHTATSLTDPRAFAERRAPLEALAGVPLWWKSGPS